MAIDAPFSTIEEADEAYYVEGSSGGSGGGGGGGGGGGNDTSNKSWQQIERVRVLNAGWVLGSQTTVNQDSTRYFVLRRESANSPIEAINSGGQVETFDAGATGDTLPSYPTESDAVAAYEKWAEENGAPSDGETGGDSSGTDGSNDTNPENWGEWERKDQVGDWYVFGRQHNQNQSWQWMGVAVVNRGGEEVEVYLNDSGDVVEEPYIWTNRAKLIEAIRAFSDRAENGDVPEEDQPTGQAPAEDNVEEDAGQGKPGQNKWGSWSKLQQVADWWVYARQHQSKDQQQFLASSKLGDGTVVYLSKDGEVVEKPAIFDDVNALKKALQAYLKAKANGEVPEGRVPTGDATSVDRVAKDVNESGGSDGILGFSPFQLAIGAAAIGAYWYYTDPQGQFQGLGEIGGS